MSRTKHGHKGAGYEYWGRRPGTKKVNGGVGKWAKRVTHKAERRANSRAE